MYLSFFAPFSSQSQCSSFAAHPDMDRFSIDSEKNTCTDTQNLLDDREFTRRDQRRSCWTRASFVSNCVVAALNTVLFFTLSLDLLSRFNQELQLPSHGARPSKVYPNSC